MFSNDKAVFAELNDLKRIVTAGRTNSIATHLFDVAWSALAAGCDLQDVTWRVTGRAITAARLGGIDADVMSDGGLSSGDVSAILTRAAEAVIPSFAISLKPQLLSGCVAVLPGSGPRRPAFVDRLAAQPRAGITCPGKPRILLEPAENHADHCLLVAVYGVLLSPVYGADPARVFLAALAHHLHNAGMPDSGFSGEMLLGRHLDTLVAHYTEACLDELAPALRLQVQRARAILPDADTPDGRAFHAADVLDRVLQTIQYTRAASLTTEQMLGEMELVHAGPVKSFQDHVLREAGLL